MSGGAYASPAPNMADASMWPHSVPPGRAGGRGTSPRRRLRSEFDAEGNVTGVSPKAKRPAAYVQPPPVPHGQTMSTDEVVNQVIQNRMAIEQLHAWVASVADAVYDHAATIDAGGIDAGVMAAKLAAFERQLNTGMANAEGKLTGTFAKVDELIAELRGQTSNTAAELIAKTELLEQAVKRLEASMPPGLSGPVGSGGGGGGGHVGVMASTMDVMGRTV